MSVTDLCAYCGGDCGMSDCPVCHGCEGIACPDCDNPYQPDPADPAEADDHGWGAYGIEDYDEEDY
jgi:hypothetical protein